MMLNCRKNLPRMGLIFRPCCELFGWHKQFIDQSGVFMAQEWKIYDFSL